MKRIRVWMTKDEIEPERLVGATAVVIDVLLAATTLLTIAERGARRIVAAGSMEDVRARLLACEGLPPLTGGEDLGARITDFECGPYPDEFSVERVAGRDVLFLSTNGTRAMVRSSTAARLLVGCLRNAPAIARHLQTSVGESIYLICAGMQGHASLEDLFCAGVILREMDLGDWRLNDAAWVARDLAQRYQSDAIAVMQAGRVGRWFVDQNLEDVLAFAADIGASRHLIEVHDGELRSMVDHAVAVSVEHVPG